MQFHAECAVFEYVGPRKLCPGPHPYYEAALINGYLALQCKCVMSTRAALQCVTLKYVRPLTRAAREMLKIAKDNT